MDPRRPQRDVEESKGAGRRGGRGRKGVIVVVVVIIAGGRRAIAFPEQGRKKLASHHAVDEYRHRRIGSVVVAVVVHRFSFSFFFLFCGITHLFLFHPGRVSFHYPFAIIGVNFNFLSFIIDVNVNFVSFVANNN